MIRAGAIGGRAIRAPVIGSTGGQSALDAATMPVGDKDGV